MEREEILSKVRNGKKAYDEREQGIRTKSSAIGKAVGVLLGFVIVLIETICFDRPPVASLAAYSVVFIMEAVESWYRFALLKGKFNIKSDYLRFSVCRNFSDVFCVSVNYGKRTFYKLYSAEKMNDAVHYAKELKDRYTVLWMYYDMFGEKTYEF